MTAKSKKNNSPSESDNSFIDKRPTKDVVTFTEDEVRKIGHYMNFVNTHADFTIKPPQMQEFIKLTSSLIGVMKKCEAHIFEIKSVTRAGE